LRSCAASKGGGGGSSSGGGSTGPNTAAHFARPRPPPSRTSKRSGWTTTPFTSILSISSSFATLQPRITGGDACPSFSSRFLLVQAPRSMLIDEESSPPAPDEEKAEEHPCTPTNDDPFLRSGAEALLLSSPLDPVGTLGGSAAELMLVGAQPVDGPHPSCDGILGDDMKYLVTDWILGEVRLGRTPAQSLSHAARGRPGEFRDRSPRHAAERRAESRVARAAPHNRLALTA
jgi:hypothetical protein